MFKHEPARPKDTKAKDTEAKDPKDAKASGAP
jgi:hypothetical protein